MAAGLALAAAVLAADWRIVALAFAAVLLALAVLRFPFFGVVFYLLLAIIHPEELGLAPVVLRLQLVFALICATVYALPGLLRGYWRRWEWLGTDKPLAFLCIAACLSVPLSVSRPGSATACYELGKLVFAYIIVRQTVASFPRLRAVVWVIVLATAVQGALAIGHTGVGEGGVIRQAGATSTAGDPNALANAMVCGLPLMVLLVGAEGGFVVKALLVGMAGLDLFIAFRTGSRTGIVSLAVVVLFLVSISKRKVITAVALAATVVVLWVMLPPDLKHRYETIRTYQQEATYQTRRDWTKLAFRMMRDHPITGVGLGQFMVARVEQYDGIWMQPHNVYAEVAGEMGFIGLAAYLVFVVSVFSVCRSVRRQLPHLDISDRERRWLDAVCLGTMVMFAALLVQGLGGHNFFRWNYYLGAAVATACLQWVRAARQNDSRAAEGGQPPSL
ncbi:MAG: O-antigen ligase family protein [Armatimonadota bacterium]